MLQEAMPGETFLSSDCHVGCIKTSVEMDDPNKKLQEMAEKLEKSEAGRKKLRQAITMLKEKMEATEKVLQVNETLRKECERERLRAEVERKKAEEEKTLRLQIEKESLSVKEQLVRVLQRLDAVERNSKSDRLETDRVRGEMRQAVSALSGALQVAEAAQSSLQGLERSVQDKVNNAASTSSKALSLAQSVSCDANAPSAEKTSPSVVSRVAAVQKQCGGFDRRLNLIQKESSKALSLAQSASSDAKAAQVVAAAVEKMSQSLVSRVATTQKQSAGLDQRLNLLQQEFRTRFVDVGSTSSGVRVLDASVASVAKKLPSKGMVLSKSQQLNGAGFNTPKPPNRRSMAGSADISHDAGQTEIVLGSTGVCAHPENHPRESIQVVDSGSSSGCTSTFSRELALVSKNKVINPTRGCSESAVAKRPSTTFRPTSTAAPRFKKPANVPVGRNGHSSSSKSTTGQEGTQSSSKLGDEPLRRAKVDSSNGSMPASGDCGESNPGNVDISIPQITATSRMKLSSKRCSASGPITSDFSARQRICGALNTEEDCAQTAPLRGIEGGKTSKSPKLGEFMVAEGQRKVKHPAALLKDITKLFSREKKVHSRMEAKFMALEQALQTGLESGSRGEQTSAQETRKRKRREKDSDRSKKKLKEVCDQELKKETVLNSGAHIKAAQAVGDCAVAAGKRAIRSKSKDSVAADPSTPVQSTPPFALPKVSESVVAEIFMTAEVQDQPIVEDTGGDGRALGSISHPFEGDRCSVLVTQPRKGMETDRENHSAGVNWCRDVAFDGGGTNEWTVTCSSGLLGTAGMSVDEKEHTHDMDIDRGNDRLSHVSREEPGQGWDTESDLSDEELDPEWWATKRVLLSPTLPELQPHTGLDGISSDTSLACSSSKDMSLEEMDLFLDVLPPVPGEGCEEAIKDLELPHISEIPTLDDSVSGSIRSEIDKLSNSGVAEVQVLPSESQTLNVLADQLQDFLIQGCLRPVCGLETRLISKDYREEVAFFQVPASTSDVKGIGTVIKGSKLLASLCLKAGMTDYLRKSMYLILRFCNKESSWLLAAISSFLSVCGKQLLSADVGDIVGQAVLIVVSELLDDAEATEAAGIQDVITYSSSENVGELCEEMLDKSMKASSRSDENFSSYASNLHILRDSIGERQNDLNFEAFLPKILQMFLDVITPKIITTLSNPDHCSPDPACVERLDESDRPSTDSSVSIEGAVPANRDTSVSSESAVPANTVDGASLQLCQKVGMKERSWCCWQCSYSASDSFGPSFVKRMDKGMKSGYRCMAWEQKFHEITHALELVACHLGWEWTYNDLIVEHLWKLVQPGAPDVTVVFVAKSLGIFGRLGIEIDGTELQGVEELRRSLIAILRSDCKVAGVEGETSAFSFDAQVAAAQSLLDLLSDAKRDQQNIPAPERASYVSLREWSHALDPNLLESLPLSLRSSFNKIEE